MTAKAIAHISDTALTPAPRRPNLRQRILVVDDDPYIRCPNSELLRRCGYHVGAAADGAEAWEAIQADNYDLLITDYQMPIMDGVELLKRMHAAGLMLPVIMVTSAYPEYEFVRHPELQIEVCLLKPHRFDELLTTVKNVLHAHAGEVAEQVPPPNWMRQPPPAGLRSEAGAA